MVFISDDLRALERQEERRRQLALEMGGYEGFLNSMLTPDDKRRFRRGQTQEELQRQQEFQRLLDNTLRMSRDAQEAADRALKITAERVRQAEVRLEDIRSRATEAEDGRKAYRTADNQQAYFDDGEKMSAAQMNRTQWRPEAPTWEERQKAGRDLDAAIKDHEDVKAYKDRADYYRARAGQGDLSADDLRDIQADLQVMPQAVRDELNGRRGAAAPSQAEDPVDFAFSAADLADIRKAAPAEKKQGPGGFSL